MILCTKCRKLWPAGSVYCGECGRSLGVRICKEGHENLLTAKVCSECGSQKLSEGVVAYRLRFVTVGLVAAFALLLTLAFAEPLSTVLRGLLDKAIILLIAALFWSFVITIFFGDRGARLVNGFWRAVGQLATALPKLLMKILSKK